MSFFPLKNDIMIVRAQPLFVVLSILDKEKYFDSSRGWCQSEHDKLSPSLKQMAKESYSILGNCSGSTSTTAAASCSGVRVSKTQVWDFALELPPPGCLPLPSKHVNKVTESRRYIWTTVASAWFKSFPCAPAGTDMVCRYRHSQQMYDADYAEQVCQVCFETIYIKMVL